MAFTLRVLFDGLCIFVPNTDESAGVRVLMIDARAPGVASNGENHVSHIPSVRFDLADLVPGRRQPSYRVEFAVEQSIPRGQWYLNGDDLEIRANGQGLPDEPLTVLRSHATRDFSLIPTMQAIYPDTGGIAVRDECLDNDLRRLADAGLVGRLRLQAGVLGAWDGSEGRYISSDEYMFTGNPVRHRQRIASRSFFETHIEADEVEIFSRQRGHGLVLRSQHGELVEITLENQPPADLMSAKPSDPTADYDFELVYLIAKDPPLPLRIPVLAAEAWASAGEPSALSGAANPKCPPAAYNPNSEAAGTVSRPICTGATYDPSSEAGLTGPKCPPAAYNPSSEATGGYSGPICPGATFSPNREAGLMDRPSCPGSTFNPSREANFIDRPVCPGATFSPDPKA